MERIESAEALTRLLDRLGWFEDTFCMDLSPPPGGAVTPDRVELVLREEITPRVNADVRTFRVSRLSAMGVSEWSFRGDVFCHGSDHCVESAELITRSSGFGFGIDVPTFAWVVADAFTYERLRDVTEPMPPWTEDTGLAVTAAHARAPSPSQWVQALARNGVEVTWRMFGGPAHPTEQVPADYAGWFLERPSRLSDRGGGIFIRHLADGVVNMERRGIDDELWFSACRAMAHWFPDGEFDSGIHRFTAGELLAHLATDT